MPMQQDHKWIFTATERSPSLPSGAFFRQTRLYRLYVPDQTRLYRSDQTRPDRLYQSRPDQTRLYRSSINWQWPFHPIVFGTSQHLYIKPPIFINIKQVAPFSSFFPITYFSNWLQHFHLFSSIYISQIGCSIFISFTNLYFSNWLRHFLFYQIHISPQVTPDLRHRASKILSHTSMNQKCNTLEMSLLNSFDDLSIKKSRIKKN